MLVFLDLEKAFDSVDWQYMQAVLQHMGFGEVFFYTGSSYYMIFLLPLSN